MSTSASPHVLIVGGFLTEPAFYWPMRARLLARGVAHVSIAPLHLPDWLAMGIAGLGPSMLRTAVAIRRARRASTDPIIVVGHSAGGILARLAMCDAPFDGRVAGVADDVGCLVTLGTPHALHAAPLVWRHAGAVATGFLERASPGACFAPTTGYLTVGSTFARAGRASPTNAIKRAIGLAMHTLVAQAPGARGDGIVDEAMCRLEGARHISLPDVLHGTFGGPWYGDAKVIDRWWPAAVEEWRAALRSRERALLRPALTS